MYTFKPKGVCSKSIEINVENNKITHVFFQDGCPGSLFAIGRLVEGMTPDEAIKRCAGIACGKKSTSCPDQLAQALTAIKDKTEHPQLTFTQNASGALSNSPFGIQAEPKNVLNPFA